MESAHLVQVVLPGIVDPEGLQIRQAAVPDAGPGQIVIAMEATGVSFAKQQMRRGRYYDQPPFPFVPGYDLVGRVLATGPGVDPNLAGRRVAALVKVGAWASHVVVDAEDAVLVPDGLSATEAETVVVNGITARQMLHSRARVRAGQTVLVHGAGGGVGSVLVQLARAAGVKVIGTASPRHHEALRELDVIPVDYRDGDSDVEPGSTPDITAARIHALPALYKAALAAQAPNLHEVLDRCRQEGMTHVRPTGCPPWPTRDTSAPASASSSRSAAQRASQNRLCTPTREPPTV
ncbi:alcohol dehydrogenase catalytic domain-containing protein [Streptomyces sp. NPDC056165]|uniref:alcohol dehydrogenase catalytic domain-containing protein n=1 Tax=Streptomyces sp. NPDC056165 TaxID=3345733 RepID=UPI0035E0742E